MANDILETGLFLARKNEQQLNLPQRYLCMSYIAVIADIITTTGIARAVICLEWIFA